jgi:hypothetical protein
VGTGAVAVVYTTYSSSGSIDSATVGAGVATGAAAVVMFKRGSCGCSSGV